MLNNMRPIHPGEILREEYIVKINMSINVLAHELHIPATRLRAIVNERRAITADTALRLAYYFGGDAQSWLNLQSTYDLKLIELERGAEIKKQISPREA